MNFVSIKKMSRRRKRADPGVPVNLESTISKLVQFGKKRIGTEMPKIPEADVVAIIAKAKYIFAEQPMLLELDPPMVVLGDIHGDLQTLVQIFETGGSPRNTNYVFNGDYVDRGRYSLEVILLLFCFKILRPKNFFLLRGNHEAEMTTKQYGFEAEVFRKQSRRVYKLFLSAFNVMPVASLIADQIFTCHGGISFNMDSFDDIRKIKRPTDIPLKGLMADLTWSDPTHQIDGWAEHRRGIGYAFGRAALTEWMEKHGVTLVIRAHQVVQDGYEFFANKRLITIFSAPNYTNHFDNKAGMVRITKDLRLSVKTLKAPKKAAALTWGTYTQSSSGELLLTPPPKVS